MKANEALEKIFITPNFDRRWFTKEIDDESVEYILADAFIEKAAEWQRKELCNYFDAPIEDFERFIEDFKKAMKL